MWKIKNIIWIHVKLILFIFAEWPNQIHPMTPTMHPQYHSAQCLNGPPRIGWKTQHRMWFLLRPLNASVGIAMKRFKKQLQLLLYSYSYYQEQQQQQQHFKEIDKTNKPSVCIPAVIRIDVQMPFHQRCSGAGVFTARSGSLAGLHKSD